MDLKDVPLDNYSGGDTIRVFHDGRWMSWAEYEIVAPPAPEETRATCADGTEIEIRPEGGEDDRKAHRWFIFEKTRTKKGKWVWTRRKDFASPSADHARRTVEYWHGRAIGGWFRPTEKTDADKNIQR